MLTSEMSFPLLSPSAGALLSPPWPGTGSGCAMRMQHPLVHPGFGPYCIQWRFIAGSCFLLLLLYASGDESIRTNQIHQSVSQQFVK